MDEGREGGVVKERERGREGGKERESPEDGGGCKCRNAYASAGVTYETSFLNVEK